jgi:HPt (histidine-containing phosphotransfer) domain-containing protein
MGQDLALFKEMAGFLANDGRRYLDEVKAALCSKNAVCAKERAHALKGIISNFGGSRAWLAAERVEGLARAGKLEEASSCLAELELAFAELLDALRPYLAAG